MNGASLTIIMLLLSTISIPAFVPGQEKVGNEESLSNTQLAGGYFEALQANLAAISSGEALISVHHHFDSTRKNEDKMIGVVHTVDDVFRFRFDYEKKTYLLIRSQDTVIVDMEADEDSPHRFTRGTAYAGMVLKDGKATYHLVGSAPLEREEKDDAQVLNGNDAPDFRKTGFMRVTASLSAEDFSNFVNRRFSPSSIKNIKNQGNELQFTIEEKSPRGDIDFVRDVQFTFDAKNLVPRKIVSYGTHLSPVYSRGLNGESHFEWKEFEGVFVPTYIRYVSGFSERVHGRRESALKTTEYEVNWISLNEDFDESDFDPIQVTDTSRLIRLLQIESAKDEKKTDRQSDTTSDIDK